MCFQRMLSTLVTLMHLTITISLSTRHLSSALRPSVADRHLPAFQLSATDALQIFGRLAGDFRGERGIFCSHITPEGEVLFQGKERVTMAEFRDRLAKLPFTWPALSDGEAAEADTFMRRLLKVGIDPKFDYIISEENRRSTNERLRSGRVKRSNALMALLDPNKRTDEERVERAIQRVNEFMSLDPPNPYAVYEVFGRFAGMDKAQYLHKNQFGRVVEAWGSEADGLDFPSFLVFCGVQAGVGSGGKLVGATQRAKDAGEDPLSDLSLTEIEQFRAKLMKGPGPDGAQALEDEDASVSGEDRAQKLAAVLNSPAPELGPSQEVSWLDTRWREQFNGEQLADLIVQKYGVPYVIHPNRLDWMGGRRKMFYQITWRYLGEPGFEMTKDQYLDLMETLAYLLVRWNRVDHFRNQVAKTRKVPDAYFGRAVPIALDVPEEEVSVALQEIDRLQELFGL